MIVLWHYLRQGQQAGPVDEEELQQLVRNGVLGPDDPVWNESMPDWKPAREVPELEQALAAAPSGAVAVLPYQGPSVEGLTMTAHGIEMLRQTRPWVRFVGVLLYVAAGFTAVAGVVITASELDGGTALGLVYVAMAALYIAPGIFLNRYATRINDLLTLRREEDLEQAMQAQKSFWRFVGIAALVILILYGVVLLIIGVVAIFTLL